MIPDDLVRNFTYGFFVGFIIELFIVYLGVFAGNVEPDANGFVA
jgi:hypothetical protein